MKQLIRKTRAQESRTAIERLYISMRHLFNRGYYRPGSKSGTSIVESLRTLQPEIYGSINDPEKVELDGLVYVITRLPKGIEECRLIKLTSDEGYRESDFPVLVPSKRRRNCYRIDPDQMFIEVTRGRSEIYDVLTHLTFLFLESRKIRKKAIDEDGRETWVWKKIREIIEGKIKITDKNREVTISYLSTILGRTFLETERAYRRFNEEPEANNDLFHVVYWMGMLAIAEQASAEGAREITFTSTLRERIGLHIYGSRWAANIKQFMFEQGLLDRPLHVISANLHSVLNSIYAYPALGKEIDDDLSIIELATNVISENPDKYMPIITSFGKENGLYVINDESGTNIAVQIIDTARVDRSKLSPELKIEDEVWSQKPVILVMDYAFGEQAYETMDELLRPFMGVEAEKQMNLVSVNIMGKAGILVGDKGDIMIPTAHVFEGSADNYPINNEFTSENFKDYAGRVFEGPMITVLGTSLQNRDVLSYFKNTSWKAIGLEMEGVHYQKAIQAATAVRKVIQDGLILRYAYYASDNPLVSGGTLASGSLGLTGVLPTYYITLKMLNAIFSAPAAKSPEVLQEVDINKS